MYETLLNLEERLIIFREKKEVDFSDSLVIELNPFLEEAFYDLISVEQLLKDVALKVKESSGVELEPEVRIW